MGKRRSFRRMKIPKRFTPLLFPLLLSGFMTFLITGVSMARVLGIDAFFNTPSVFLQTWMKAYISAWLVAYPVLLLVIPVVRKIVNWLTSEE
jgi:hypothetical protein